MNGFFIFLIVLAILILIYAGVIFSSEKYLKNEGIKEDIEQDYNQLMDLCKTDYKVLKWVSTLNERIVKLLSSNEFVYRKPYDKYKLLIPAFNVKAYIVIDKYLTPRFVVFTSEDYTDSLNRDLYLKNYIKCDEIESFIDSCKRESIEYNLEEKRKEKIAQILNN